MKFLKTSLTLLILLLFTNIQAQDVQATFEKLARSYEKYVNTGQSENVGSLYTPDAVFTDEYGESYTGKKAITKRWKNTLSQVKYKGLKISISEIMPLGSDLYMGRGGYMLTASAGDMTMDVQGQYYIICKVKNDKILIHRHISSRNDKPM